MSNSNRDKAIATRFAVLNNKAAVGREFGVSARTVGRILDRAEKASATVPGNTVPQHLPVTSRGIKEGDLVVGNNPYRYTNSESLCRVDSISGNSAKITLLSSTSDHGISLLEQEGPFTFQVRVNDLTKVGSMGDKAPEATVNIVGKVFENINTGSTVKVQGVTGAAATVTFMTVSRKGQQMGVFCGTVVRISLPTLLDKTLFKEIAQIVEAPGEVAEQLEEADIAEEVEEDIDYSTADYVMTPATITLTISTGESRTVDKTHKSFTVIRQKILEGVFEEAFGLMDVARGITKWSGGQLTIEDGVVTYRGMDIYSALGDKILSMMAEGDKSFERFAKFLQMTLQNPSFKSRKQLMNFASARDIMIDKDGYIVAFKNVNSDFTDKHSGTFNNSVGRVVKVDRSEVDDNELNTCSHGLHVCSVYYLKSAWGTSGKTVRVRVHPRDMVAVPGDYKNSKARVCKYRVMEDVSDDLQKYLDMVD